DPLVTGVQTCALPISNTDSLPVCLHFAGSESPGERHLSAPAKASDRSVQPPAFQSRLRLCIDCHAGISEPRLLFDFLRQEVHLEIGRASCREREEGGV